MSDTPCDRIALELAATIAEARDDANTFAAIADPRTPPEPSPADLRGVELLDRTTEAAHHAIAACAAITLDTLVEYTTDLALVRTLLVHIADSLVVIQAHHEALEELDELKARLRHPSHAGKVAETDDVVDAEVAPCDRSTSPCDDDPDSPCAFPGCDLNAH